MPDWQGRGGQPTGFPGGNWIENTGHTERPLIGRVNVPLADQARSPMQGRALALAHALRLAKEGQPVWFTCSSRKLAARAAAMLGRATGRRPLSLFGPDLDELVSKNTLYQTINRSNIVITTPAAGFGLSVSKPFHVVGAFVAVPGYTALDAASAILRVRAPCSVTVWTTPDPAPGPYTGREITRVRAAARRMARDAAGGLLDVAPGDPEGRALWRHELAGLFDRVDAHGRLHGNLTEMFDLLAARSFPMDDAYDQILLQAARSSDASLTLAGVRSAYRQADKEIEHQYACRVRHAPEISPERALQLRERRLRTAEEEESLARFDLAAFHGRDLDVEEVERDERGRRRECLRALVDVVQLSEGYDDGPASRDTGALKDHPLESRESYARARLTLDLLKIAAVNPIGPVHEFAFWPQDAHDEATAFRSALCERSNEIAHLLGIDVDAYPSNQQVVALLLKRIGLRARVAKRSHRGSRRYEVDREHAEQMIALASLEFARQRVAGNLLAQRRACGAFKPEAAADVTPEEIAVVLRVGPAG